MQGEKQHGMQCHEFEGLVSDALDGSLQGMAQERFQAHAAVCAQCGPMFASAQTGMHWLRSLAEVEPSRHLVHNILVATTGAKAAERAEHILPRRSMGERMRRWLRPVFAPVFGMIVQPRFALTFGMALFSISVALSALGLHVTDLRHADLRPAAIRKNVLRRYYENSARVVRYYENVRLFQQFEAQVRDLKQATKPAEERRHSEQNKKNRHYRDDNTSGPTNRNLPGRIGNDALAWWQSPRRLGPALALPRRTA